MSGSILATIAMVATLFGILKYTENEFDKNGMIFISMSIILLWVIPGGYLVILPLAIILSVISPAARSEWAEHRKTRIIAIGMVFLVMNLFWAQKPLLDCLVWRVELLFFLILCI